MGWKRKIIPLIGWAMLATAASLFIYYEFLGGREFINYEEVIVFNQEVGRGYEVKEDDDILQIIKIEKHLVFGVITDIDSIVGKVVKNFIPGGTPLHSYYFDEVEFVLEKDQYIAKVPEDWIYAVPESIRRGDYITFFSYFDPNKQSGSVSPTIKQDVPNQNESLNTLKSLPKLKEMNDILDTRVIYVKDGQNREVITVSEKDRYDGSGKVKDIEIVTSKSDFRQLEEVIEKGGQLIIMYSEEEFARKELNSDEITNN